MIPKSLNYMVERHADVPHVQIHNSEGGHLGDLAGAGPDEIATALRLVVAYNHFEALLGAVNTLLAANSSAAKVHMSAHGAQTTATAVMDAIVADVLERGGKIVG